MHKSLSRLTLAPGFTPLNRTPGSRLAAAGFRWLGTLLIAGLLCGGGDGTTPATAQTTADGDGNTWLQWRGPTRDGRFYGPAWPDKLSADRLREVWRVPLQPSYSGPIVTADRVITTETQDKARERVSAYDRSSGKLLWEQTWDGAIKVPFFAAANGSWIRSTPACDGDTLYVGGIRELLAALDVATGEILWKIDCTQQFGSEVPAFGFVCSPLVEGDALYVQAAQSIMKLDKDNGNVIWQAGKGPGGMYGGAFSSPVLTELAGRALLLVCTRNELKMIDAIAGEELYSREIPSFRGMNILTPTVYQDAVFVSAHSGSGELFRVSQEEGTLQVDEGWNNRKLEGYMSTPVIVGDYAYLHLKNQRFACFDLRTGEEKWRTQPFGKYWSLVTQGDKILALDERGELLLIRANPEAFEVLDRRKISEDSTWAHLAVAGREVFVRELGALVAYRWE